MDNHVQSQRLVGRTQRGRAWHHWKLKSEEFDQLTQAAKGHAKGPGAIISQFFSLSPESDVVFPDNEPISSS